MTRVMVQCRTEVKRDAVRRETIDGVEHVIISSNTLPDDIVMNGGLYPANEIASSFNSLELTLAPVEHPRDKDGNFISASDPRAIHGYHAGAYNMNVTRSDGRVHIDKYIDIQEALKSDLGKRLLDRISELENNEKARPIHTSVGVFVQPEQLSEMQTNEQGQEYSWVATNMVFDHDAILLDSVGAAQPNQGVGMAVNKQGEHYEVNSFELSRDSAAGSLGAVHDAVLKALEDSASAVSFIEELFPDRVVFNSGEQLFEVPFTLNEQTGLATIVGIPLPVEKDVTFTPTTNQLKGDYMKELILNALTEAGVETEDKSDAELFKAYNELSTKEEVEAAPAAPAELDMTEVVANALKPLMAEIEGLKANQQVSEQAELASMADLVANSGKYPGIDADTAKLMGVEKLKELVANCAPAYGISPVYTTNKAADTTFNAPTDMPE